MYLNVGIVIVNWNKPRELMRLLDSLVFLVYDNHKIFVVDNASTDDSLEVMRAHILQPKILINSENLGGTGGFNSGIRFALDSDNFDYLWLLDNDAFVTPLALHELVQAMAADTSVGLAGSRILNSADPRYIVETGAFFDWREGTVRPLQRNIRKSDVSAESMITVDYVAVCSALVRVSALSRVGLMDERYFLFWDDMDWGIAFQDAGYRVVAVPSSEVFHAAFTEYRSIVVDAYYGVRNQLLTFSKYRHHAGAWSGMYQMLRRVAKGSLLTCLSGKSGGMLGMYGFWDFFCGRWGKIARQVPAMHSSDLSHTAITGQWKKALVIPMKDVNNTEEVVLLLRKTGVEVDILVSKDRKLLFQKLQGLRLIEIDYTSPHVMRESVAMFMKIFLSGYDVSVKTSSDKISPFTYAIRTSVAFEQNTGDFQYTGEGLGHIWRILFAVVLGEILGLIMYIFAWIKGFCVTSDVSSFREKVLSAKTSITEKCASTSITKVL